MPHVPLLPPTDAAGDVQAVYEEFYRRMSFPSPPNFIMTQGHSPTVVRGTWEVVRNVLVTGEIPRWTKEMIFVAISNDRNCRYCSAADIACCRMLGVNPEMLSGGLVPKHPMVGSAGASMNATLLRYFFLTSRGRENIKKGTR